MPGDEVEVGALDGEDGTRLLHGPVVRVRALLHGRVERVELVQVDRLRGPGCVAHGAACWHASPSGRHRAGRVLRSPPGAPAGAGAVWQHRRMAEIADGPSVAEVTAALTAPGQLFEMEEVVIRGIPTRTWKHAPPSLRAVLEGSRAHGATDFLVYEDDHLTFDGHFRTAATPRPPAGRRPRRAAGRPGGHRDAELPGVVRRVLGRGVDRRGRRAAQRVVDRTRAGVRAGRLGLRGARLRRRAGRPPRGAPGEPAGHPHDDRRQARGRATPGRTAPSRSRTCWARSTRRRAARAGASIPRTTPRSSTPRARPAGPRAPSARSATSARNLISLAYGQARAAGRAAGRDGAAGRRRRRRARTRPCCRSRSSTPPAATRSSWPTSPSAGRS